jgi:3'(2'), 5'-bisphosphate nucleotidase
VTDTFSDDALAHRLAEAAGEILLAIQRSTLLTGKPLGAAGDAVANAFILRVLAEQRPDDFLLSEESAPDPNRIGKPRVWIIDPLDGTREFSEGRGDWAVHVALTEHGLPTASAVALPGLGVVLSTDTPPLVPHLDKPLRIVVSRTRPPLQAQAAAKALGAELVPMGSAGAKTMAVVRGEAHAYIHSGGQYEWDSCAPVGVAQAAGLHVSRIDGSALIYNREDPYLPDLLVCVKELAEPLLAAIAAA